MPFKAIILKNVYAAGAFLLHIKILEKQEKEIDASLEINHCWHSLGSLTVILYGALTFVHIYKILYLFCSSDLNIFYWCQTLFQNNFKIAIKLHGTLQTNVAIPATIFSEFKPEF